MVESITSRKRILFLVASCCLFSLTAVLLMRQSSASVMVGKLREPSRQGTTDITPVLRIFVHNEDIYPPGIKITAGPVRLHVERQTLSDAVLVLDRVSPGQANLRLLSVKAQQTARRAEQRIELTPGDYIYYDEARPEIVGHLLVEDK